MAVLLLLVAAAAAADLGDLTRRDTGDVFTILGGNCNAARCAEHGAGTTDSRDGSDICACSCPQRAPLFREDRELCVDDLPECSLATFGTGLGTQRIPFVYLPLKGQIIHPSREITFQNVKTPICAVSGAQFLTRKGFLDLRNTLDADVPFNLFRDEGRTFLQWSGEDDVRRRMSGRVMVVRLLCRDIAAPSSPLDLRGVFTPCVAFRVQGTPPRHANNITEVQFTPNAQISETSASSGLTVSEYVAIGISSLLLGLIYVASVFLYLHIKKKRKATAKENGLRKLKGLKKDGLTITEHDIIRIKNERIQSLPSALGQDDGVIKNNPLLSVGRQFHDNKSFPNDLSDSDDFADNNVRNNDNTFHNQTISAVIHRHIHLKSDNIDYHRDESIERLPDEHVSIVETIDDREITRPVGTTRRKLYFNPAYFEPQLMADPPPAAIEFLSKIREVIAIAKQKMASKRFHPVLNEIPEEETYPSNGNSIDLYHGLGSQRSGSLVSLKRENSRKRSANCMGCPGCKSNDSNNDVQNLIKQNIATSCTNCFNEKGEKQNSIRKWLENIPNVKNSMFNDGQQNSLVNSLHSLPNDVSQCKLQKQNSFSHAMHLSDDFLPQRVSRSVRSEPPLRNYSIPLPEFNMAIPPDQNCQTVSRINDLRTIGLNQYNDETEVSNQNRNTLQNKNALPDMVNEAVALDHFSRSLYNSSSDEERFPRSMNKNISDSPSGNEYETDSLERGSNKKTKPLDYPDVPSSQASPSLSNALPLEEELTMRNAVYKTHSSSNSNTPSPEIDICIEENHYETIDVKKIETDEPTIDISVKPNSNYSLVSEVYVNNYNFGSAPTSPSGSECSMGSRKLMMIDNSVEKPGCLTIELKDPPENYIKIHESDGFEPDTLDRKHSKHKDLIESTKLGAQDYPANGDSLEKKNSKCNKFGSSGTFSKNNGKNENFTRFNSLRNDHEYILNRSKLSPTLFSGSKSLDNTTDDTWDDGAGWSSEEGRILTLELRHSKRQRQSTPPTIKQIKNLARPDILPPLPPTEDSSIYKKPINPPKRVPHEDQSKNMPSKNFTMKNKRNNVEIFGQLPQPNSICGITCGGISKVDDEGINTLKSSEKDAQNDLCRRPSSGCSSAINTNTFVKGPKVDTKTKLRRRKGSNIEDSGYLSSDSTCSKQVQRKIVIAKISSCSESDETEDEARSESGAESVETHSVYFGNCHKVSKSDENIRNTIKITRDSKRKVKIKSEINK